MLGYYVHDLTGLKELADAFGTTTDVMSDIVNNTGIKRKLSDVNNDDDACRIIDEFAEEVCRKLKK